MKFWRVKSVVKTATTTPIASLNDSDVQEIQSGKPRIVKRAQQVDLITANFKRRSKYMWVDFDKIRVDISYQRTLQRKKVVQMAHRWNPDKAGTLVLSKRDDGLFYIIDGQHRHAAMSLISNRPPKVYAEVYTNLTLEEEAQLFHDLDNERDNLTPGASFRALMTAKDPIAMGVSRAANNAGMTVDYNRGPVVGNVRAYKTLQDIYRRSGEKMLERILRICNKAWPTSNHASPQPIMRGLEILLTNHPTLKDSRLIDVLSKIDPHLIILAGRQINGTLSSAIYPSIAIVLRNMYNRKLGENRRLDANISLGM